MEDASVTRLLLVHRDGADLRRIRQLLSELPPPRYEVTWAADLATAEEAIRRASHAVCLLAEELGDGTGMELLEAVTRNAADLPVIVLTRSREAAFGEAVLHAGAADYLVTDDLTVPLLARAIRYALTLRALNRSFAANRERLRLTEDQIPGVVWTMDRDLRITWVGGRGLHWLGVTPQGMVGQSLQAAIPALEVPPGILDAHRAALQGESMSYESVLAERRWETHVRPLRGADGAVTGIIGLAIDVTERREAERALRESEERYRTLVHHSNEVVTILSADGTIRYESSAVKRLLDYDPDDLVNENVFDYLHPEDRAGVQALFERNLADPEAVQVQAEVRFRHRNGTWRRFECFGSNLLPDPHIQGIVVHSRDITKQWEAEQALRKSEAAYRVVVETTRDGLITIDEAGTILFVNPAAEALFGYGAAELLDHQITLLLPDWFREALARYAVTGEEIVGGLEFRLPGRHKNGQEIPLEVSFGEWVSDGKRMLTGTFRDVSERQRAEQELREREERIRLLLDSTAEAIYGVDTDGVCTLANLACARMLGYESASQLLGAQMHHLMHHTRPDGSPYPYHECRIHAAIRRGEGTHTDDEVYWRADGTSFPVEYWSYPMLREGELVGAVVTFWDISERQALEEQLRHAQKMDAIGNLAGGLAHDFNNMLAVINGYADLILASTNDTHPLHGFLTEISKAGARAADLTRQLLAFSRKQILEPRVVDLNDAVLQLDRMLRRLIGEDIELVCLPTDGLGRVRVDPSQIEQVLMNLVINARDAMPHGGRILIQTENVTQDELAARRAGLEIPPGEYVRLSVADTGCGIKPELLDRIFEPFFTTKPQGKGTGLGLATVFGIIKQSGGYLHVDSVEGHGSTFSAYLPRVTVAPSARTEREFAPQLPRGMETILVAEDEQLVRNMVREILTNCGYTVLEALEGDEALRLAKAYPGAIHLLLTDVVMPRMNGRELAERIQELRSGLPVLFMSGYTDDARMRHGVSEDEFALIQKPFTAGALAHRVRSILNAASSGPGARRALVVDDDPGSRETLTDLLQEIGCRVATASDGRQALRVLREGPRPHVILLDLQMPGMSGWVFRLEQQKDPALAGIPVIVMSGAEDVATAGEFLTAAAHLPKPISVSDLLRALAQVTPLAEAAGNLDAR